MAAILFAVTVKAFSGIVVIDTSHAIEFTKHINVEKDREIFKDFQIVAAYKYGSVGHLTGEREKCKMMA